MTSQVAHRPSRRVATLGLLAAGALVLAGCANDPVTSPAQPGGGADTATSDSGANTSSPDAPVDPDSPTSSDDDSPAPPSSAAPTGPPVPAELTIAVDDGNGTQNTWTLRCDPDGDPADGDHPDAEAACAALAADSASAFELPAGDQMCTEQYGGPQTATIEGTVDGDPVVAEFSRTDGCEISRWEALADVFGPVAGASS